ncbi:MAG: hypothetical protein AAGA56_23665 [Myxococcota bacterium]
MGRETENLAAIYQILHSNDDSQLPTQEDVAAWVDFAGLENPTLAALDERSTLDALQRRECAYTVETEGMTIVGRWCPRECRIDDRIVNPIQCALTDLGSRL